MVKQNQVRRYNYSKRHLSKALSLAYLFLNGAKTDAEVNPEDVWCRPRDYALVVASTELTITEVISAVNPAGTYLVMAGTASLTGGARRRL